jgi:hypothetical protein
LYADGGGLYLQVAPGGGKSWVYRYQVAGRRRDMGLGPASIYGLAEARQRAADVRRMVAEGRDPIDARRVERAKAAVEAAKAITFRDAAERYIAAHEASWKNPVHRAQWLATLTAYVYPFMGELPAGAIDTGLVVNVLEPLWQTKPETASRIRGRIESILDWATARGYREGENPARWRGHLDALLPRPTRAKAAVRRDLGRQGTTRRRPILRSRRSWRSCE